MSSKCSQSCTQDDVSNNSPFANIEESVYADPVRKIQEQLYEQLIAIREGFHQTLVTAVAQVETAQT